MPLPKLKLNWKTPVTKKRNFRPSFDPITKAAIGVTLVISATLIAAPKEVPSVELVQDQLLSTQENTFPRIRDLPKLCRTWARWCDRHHRRMEAMEVTWLPVTSQLAEEEEGEGDHTTEEQGITTVMAGELTRLTQVQGLLIIIIIKVERTSHSSLRRDVDLLVAVLMVTDTAKHVLKAHLPTIIKCLLNSQSLV